MKKQFARVFSLMMISFFALGSVSGADQLTMQEGANINLSVAENGGNSTITISSTDTNTDEKVKVSSSDTADFLESQIVGGTGVNVSSDGSQITISAPPVNVEDSADGVEVTVAKQGEYDPGTGFVPVLDLNGTALVATGITPTVTIGGINASLLATSENPQQIIAGIPKGFNTGNYKLKVENNDTGFSEGLVYLNNLIGGNDTNTKLLLHGDGTGGTFTDSSASEHTVTENGDATQSSAQSQFGGKSALFDGTGDYLTIPDSNDWNFGSGDFTIDFWMNTSQVTSQFQLFAQQKANNDYPIHALGWSPTIGFIYYLRDASGTWKGDYHSALWTPGINAWHHVALVRKGTDLKVFADGIHIPWEGVSTPISNNPVPDFAEPVYFGSYGSFTHFYNGYLDELRISKGVARWTSDFSSNLPAAPYN